MTKDHGFSVSDKATKVANSDALYLGVKLQPIDQSYPFKTMMVHHANHYRSFPSNGISVGINGPTCDRKEPFFTSDIYNFVGGGVCGEASGGAVGVRTLLPFDISPTEPTATTAFKSPGGMAASLGFPFTNAQWKELERQAMIYKYIMASLPVPPHLLIPGSTPRNILPSSGAAAPHSHLLGSVVNLRFTNGADLEPGRCRRTDGKKWRCSRDVAPDQKYCERHMHRGRPRSRKHVELPSNTNNNNVNNNSKKTRHNIPATSAESPVIAAICNPSSSVDNKGAGSEFVGTTTEPGLQRPAFDLDKAATFDANEAFASTYKEPRNLDWMMKGEPAAPISATDDQQWHRLVQTEIGLATESSFNNASVLNQHYQEEILNLNSFANFSAHVKDEQSNQRCTMFLDESPRGFIDAWSNGATDHDHNTNSRNTSSISSNGKLSLSPLTLSMGGNKSMDDKMGQVQMGLSLMDSNQSHECGSTTATPGGPLAEVVQLSTLNTTTNQMSSSSVAKNGDTGSSPATTISSPSGVLQKTLASFSDSSSNSSPILASSTTNKSEIALLWLNQGKLPSAS